MWGNRSGRESEVRESGDVEISGSKRRCGAGASLGWLPASEPVSIDSENWVSLPIQGPGPYFFFLGSARRDVKGFVHPVSTTLGPMNRLPRHRTHTRHRTCCVPIRHGRVFEEDRVLLRQGQRSAKCRRLGVPGRPGRGAGPGDSQALARVSQPLKWHRRPPAPPFKPKTYARPAQHKDSSTAAPGVTPGAP